MTMPKNKFGKAIEAAANVTVIVVALAVGYVVLGRYVAAYRTPRSVSAGDLLPAIPSLDWSQHRQTLVLALRSDCHFCRDSAPFYQRLAQSKPPGGDDVEIVAVFPNDAAAVRRAMEEDALPIRSISGVPIDKWGVVGTPTLMLVDSQGQVVRSWTGVLTPQNELEVIAALGPSTQAAEVSRPLAGCQDSGGSIRSAGTSEDCQSSVQHQK